MKTCEQLIKDFEVLISVEIKKIESEGENLDSHDVSDGMDILRRESYVAGLKASIDILKAANSDNQKAA